MSKSKIQNPFEHDAASNLSESLILDIFIEDHNFSRFINSKRNVFLLGDRGSGKSMTLLYNSFKIRKLQSEKNNDSIPLDFVGVYVPCNTPLIHKKEYSLLGKKHHASVISEHIFSLTIAFWLTDTIFNIPGLHDQTDNENFKNEIEFILGEKLPNSDSV